MKNDELGTRMKENYEDRTRFTVPRRTYTVIRLDGKAFHTYTKGFERPFDLGLMSVMDKTAIALCESIQGVKMAYVQSDEISLVLTDFDTIKTDAWFDGNVQKMASISAAIASVEFNRIMLVHQSDKELKETVTVNLLDRMKLAHFDSRVFTIPDRTEVINYLIWRQQDATRNSIQMGAQSLYSQKELHGKNTSELQELMFQKGVNWDKYPVGFKRGRMILKEKKESVVIFNTQETVDRLRWDSFEPPVFTQAPGYIRGRLPVLAPPIEIGDKDLLEKT